MKKIITLLILCGMSLNVLSVTAFDRAISNTRIGGYMDTEWKSQGTKNDFKAHRYILQVGSKISDKILFNSEIEFEYGAYLNDKGTGKKKGELKIEQAWVDYKVHELFTLRTGIVLIPVGQLNIYHDSDLRDFTDRPIVNRYIIPTTWMDTGIGGHGSIDVGDAEVTYEGYITNGLKKGNTDDFNSKGTRSLRPDFKEDDNQGKSVSARIGYIPNINWSVGFSGYAGNSDQQIIAFDGKYSAGLCSLKGEYARYEDGYDNKSNGFYIEGKYNIAPMLNVGNDVNFLVRYGRVDLQERVSSAGEITRTSVGFNVRPEQLLVYKVEYQFNDGQGTLNKDDTLLASVAIGF